MTIDLEIGYDLVHRLEAKVPEEGHSFNEAANAALRRGLIGTSLRSPQGKRSSASKAVTMVAAKLPENWCDVEIATGMHLESPGIYEWVIEGRGSYIGKYTESTRATRSYARNVTNLLNNRPYRRGKPQGFRRIHQELAEAYREGRYIQLRLIENAEGADLLRRERELILERGVLNGKVAQVKVAGEGV